MLFHVEQSDGEPWRWRWRMIGDWPSPYLEWRQGGCSGRFARFQPEASGTGIEVQWRPDDESDWRDVVHYRLAAGRCRFRLTAKESVSLQRDFHHLLGRVRDHGVARYGFWNAVDLEEGESAVVEGRADAPLLANLLMEPGEFLCWDERLIVENIEPSRRSLRETEAPMVLKPVKWSRPRVFAFGQPDERQSVS